MDIAMPIKDGHAATLEIMQLQNNLISLIEQQIEEYGQSQNKNQSMIGCEIIALTSFSDNAMKEKSL